jgi:hypothetical protein
MLAPTFVSLALNHTIFTSMISESLAAIRWLGTNEGMAELRRLAQQETTIDASRILKLRDRWGVSRTTALASAATQLAKAEQKLNHRDMLATDRGLQQSTDFRIARYKANRFPVGVCVMDVCCGVGGDALALANRGPLLAIDRDPVIARIAAHNLLNSGAGNAVVTCDSAESILASMKTTQTRPWLHVDPDRRPASYRVSDPDYCEPSAPLIAELMDTCEGGAIKLSPAATVPNSWKRVLHREWISHHGTCRQQVAWFGKLQGLHDEVEPKLAGCLQSATTLDQEGNWHSFTCNQHDLNEPPRAYDSTDANEHAQQYFYDFDPAIRAAGLTMAFANWLDVRMLDGPAGFFCSSSVSPRLTDENRDKASSFASCFQVLWRGRMDEKILRRELGNHAPSSLEIKVRGLSITPESLRPRLMGKLKKRVEANNMPLTLLIGPSTAVLAQRLQFQ